MANIPQVVDSQGTVLNQYILTHSDDTQETVKLTFDPSADYQAGTAFSAATMNPIIDRLNITTATLTAGNTSITITDDRITSNNIVISIYTEFQLVMPVAEPVLNTTNHTITLTFEAQDSDMKVGIKVEGTY